MTLIIIIINSADGTKISVFLLCYLPFFLWVSSFIYLFFILSAIIVPRLNFEIYLITALRSFNYLFVCFQISNPQDYPRQPRDFPVSVSRECLVLFHHRCGLALCLQNQTLFSILVCFDS